MSKRMQALKFLKLKFQDITIANGYTTDLGTGSTWVGRFRVGVGVSDKLPMLTMLEPPLVPDQKPILRGDRAKISGWQIVIQGFIEESRDPTKEPLEPAYDFLEDVTNMLWSLKGDEGGIVDGMPKHNELAQLGVNNLRIGSGVVRPPDDISKYAYFWLDLTMDIVDRDHKTCP